MRFAPRENEEVQRLVALLRARRRRRLESSSEPFESRLCEALTDHRNRAQSIADILRSGVGAPQIRYLIPTARTTVDSHLSAHATSPHAWLRDVGLRQYHQLGSARFAASDI